MLKLQLGRTNKLYFSASWKFKEQTNSEYSFVEENIFLTGEK